MAILTLKSIKKIRGYDYDIEVEIKRLFRKPVTRVYRGNCTVFHDLHTGEMAGYGIREILMEWVWLEQQRGK